MQNDRYTPLNEKEMIENNTYSKPFRHILLVCDSNFQTTVDDLEEAKKRLYAYYEKINSHYQLVYYTLTGRYKFDDGLKELNVSYEKPNKFIKSLEYHLNDIDETLILTNVSDDEDKYLHALTDRLTERFISTSIFGYDTKEDQ